MKALWRIREDGAGILTRSPDGGEAWPGWEDAAVPPERFGAYLREFDGVLARHGRRGVYYGHFGDGCLHVRIDFDLASRRRDRELPGLPGGRGRPRRRARRVAVRRARRRLGPGRAAPPHVPAADHPGVRGVQGDLGPRRPAQPGPRRAAGQAGRRPAGLRRAAHPARLPRARVRARPRQLRPRHPPLPGRGQVRHRARRGDVPELPGHGRGDALHAGTRPAAVRDGERPGDPGRLAVRRGGRGAGPVPVVQGVQARLPGRGRHGHLQDRVPRAALPRAGAPGGALLDGRAAPLAAPGGPAAGAGGGRAERRGPGPAGGGGEAAGRDRPGARDPPDRPAPVHLVGPSPGARRGRRATAAPPPACSGPTPSPTTSTPPSPPTPSPCSRPSGTPSSCRPAPSAAR